MNLPATHRKLIAIATVTVLLAIPVVRYLWFVAVPAGSGNTARIFNFDKGYTLRKIATELQRERIVSSAGLLVMHARIFGSDDRIKAGVYRFTDGLTPPEILRMLVDGEVYSRRFSVPEGYSIYQVAELLEGKGFFGKDAFLKECFRSELLAELGVPGKSVEGFLYPSTYDITPNMTEADAIRMMVEQFRKVYAQKFAERTRAAGFTELKLVTLASMIEKEAVAPVERPLISSVFHNRLNKRMRLQSDPTAVYGVRAFGGAVSRNDVLRETPYNTYVIDGLPPGPIGNPGSEALEAALSPATTNYLYFVARKDGTHFFSTNLEDHNKAVKKFLR